MLSIFIYKAMDRDDIEALAELEIPFLARHEIVPSTDLSSSIWPDAPVVSFRFYFPDVAESSSALNRACERRVNAALNALGIRYLTPRPFSRNLSDSLQNLIEASQSALEKHAADPARTIEPHVLENLLDAVRTVSGMAQQVAREIR